MLLHIDCARDHEAAVKKERVTHQDRPINNMGRFHLNPILMNILNYADHFLLRHARILAEPFADRGRGSAPELARQVFGNHHHRSAIV